MFSSTFQNTIKLFITHDIYNKYDLYLPKLDQNKNVNIQYNNYKVYIFRSYHLYIFHDIVPQF